MLIPSRLFLYKVPIAFMAILISQIMPDAFAAQKYYLSSKGNDNNSGISKNQPWKTLERAGKRVFVNGDKLLLRAGDTFEGNLIIKKNGSKSSLEISSYGKSRATIVSKKGKAAIMIYNTANIKVSNLNLQQKGNEKDVTGIMAYCDDPDGKRFKNLIFEDLELSGFSMSGLSIGADHKSLSGFDNVLISNVKSHHNRMAGINSWGYSGLDAKGWSHRKITVRNCIAHDNYGIPEKKDSHSGNGIVIGGSAGIIIEDCEAYANGKDCYCPTMGPVGIWVWDATDAIIRRCVSHNNLTGAGKDGGGFDIDGGVSNAVMEYNISYDNAGAGFLVCQYMGSRTPLEKCIVRNNYSRNDGTVSSFAGIFVTGFDPKKPVTDITIENNVIDTYPKNNTCPAGIQVGMFGSTPCSVLVRNNLIVCNGDVTPVVVGKSSRRLVKIEGNIIKNTVKPNP